MGQLGPMCTSVKTMQEQAKINESFVTFIGLKV